MLKLPSKRLMAYFAMEELYECGSQHMQLLLKFLILDQSSQMNFCIKHFHSLVMWSELLLFVMIGEGQRDMALLSSQEKTLL